MSWWFKRGAKAPAKKTKTRPATKGRPKPKAKAKAKPKGKPTASGRAAKKRASPKRAGPAKRSEVKATLTGPAYLLERVLFGSGKGKSGKWQKGRKAAAPKGRRFRVRRK